MPFINELIPEADKTRIDWSKFKAWSFSRPLHPWKWTIDRSRDVFFVGLEGRGPDSERPETYALYWSGEVIRIEAERADRGMFATGMEVVWRIQKVEIPTNIELHRAEIISVLCEAIDAYGATHRRDVVKSVEISFVHELVDIAGLS